MEKKRKKLTSIIKENFFKNEHFASHDKKELQIPRQGVIRVYADGIIVGLTNDVLKVLVATVEHVSALRRIFDTALTEERLSSSKVTDYILEHLNAANEYCGSMIEFIDSSSGEMSNE